MYKIISNTDSFLISEDRPIQELLLEASELISKLGTSEIPISEQAKEILKGARALIGQAVLKLIDPTLSRSSSTTSVESLGYKISEYDKEFLYTYQWGLSQWTNHQEDKADFQKWLEGGYKIPPKRSILNCWQATIVNLYLYNAFDKNDLVKAFVEGKKSTSSDGKLKCIETDSDIISSFLGFWGSAHKVDSLEDIQPGDIISFTSIYGTENAHIAVTFESGDAVRLGSFWTVPKEKMILISPNKLLTVCSEAAKKSDSYEELDISQIRISKKFRAFFQSLVN